MTVGDGACDAGTAGTDSQVVGAEGAEVVGTAGATLLHIAAHAHRSVICRVSRGTCRAYIGGIAESASRDAAGHTRSARGGESSGT